MKFILGIDPGAGGALALYHPDVQQVFDMPTFTTPRNGKARKEIDGYALATLIHVHAPHITKAFIEQVGGMPGQGGQFQFGLNTGVIHGVLYANHIAIEFVPPQRWKQAMGLKRASNQTKASVKDEARKRASLLWPHMAAELARKKDDGRAESLLISYFGFARTTGARDE